MGNKKEKKYDFAFLVHPRGIADIHKKYPFLKIVPDAVLGKTFQYAPPLVVGTIKGVHGEKDKTKRGVLISIALTARQMLKNRDVAERQVRQAIKKARSLGVTHVGLGAFTSVVTSGGETVKDLYSDVHVTNGNALTAYMTYRDVVQIAETMEEKPSIAIIGASGSVGAVVSELLTKESVFKRLYTVGRTSSKIDALKNKLALYAHAKYIENVSIEDALPHSDIIVSATSADGAIVTPTLVKEGAIIYDITQPKNIHSELLTQRPDVTVYDGGLVSLPDAIHISQDLGLPKKTTFSCLGETMLLSANEYPNNFCIGKASVDQIEFIANLAVRYKFNPAKLQRWENKL